jgi:predicted small secreted protein
MRKLRYIISVGLAAATLAVVLTYVLGAPALLQTAQAEEGHKLFMSLIMPVIQSITGGHSSMAQLHGGGAPTSESTMEGMSESQMQEMRQGTMGLIGNNILGSPATLPAGGLAVNIVAGAITFAISAFVISWKQRSYLVAGLLAASGMILMILPLANLYVVSPGPIIGVIVGLMILGLGVAKGIRTATAVTVAPT